jgi:hypothetical protein
MNGKPGLLNFNGTCLVHDTYSNLLDTLKASFYANPVVDNPTFTIDEQRAFPEYYGSNICMSNSTLSWFKLFSSILFRAEQNRTRCRRV